MQEKEILKFCIFAKNQIEFFSSTQAEILKGFQTDDKCLKTFLDSVGKERWDNADLSSLCIDDQTKNILREFGSIFGKTGKSELAEHLSYSIKTLEYGISEKEKNTSEKAKVQMALGVCAGAMLIILLV